MSKVDIYSSTAETRADGTTIFWRTGRGAHRHASFYCANAKRNIDTGDVYVIPADEAGDWVPCADCCTDADVVKAAADAAAKAAAMCRNSGVTNPRRISSTCRDCGKDGKVNRATGSLRAHKPLA
jgi:hypothetical protein